MIVLFDGECNFCDKSVQFIIKRDPKGIFVFASLQSEAGQQLLKEYHVPEGIDSLILLEPDNHKYYMKSSAALRICKHLSGLWSMLYVFKLVPRTIRDRVYDLIARNRIKWFGSKDQCMLPSPEIRKRFL
ncbi:MULTISPECIES: thiol-disulfide oxidoreductase DCC family protein [unclassified Bacillus (in: firmicutes)]|uniref:thiol-disulfide oxidoreductase DCC family protein n=1 Tax=unclassified Bacillus (in: firmicutes) TaxID=185979 RepID=UPI00111CE4D5|nr:MULTISPECIES: thiol-disulfide oxidoreductase DCC family protein [unclassified Bacillus (in: firmicutes)]